MIGDSRWCLSQPWVDVIAFEGEDCENTLVPEAFEICRFEALGAATYRYLRA